LIVEEAYPPFRSAVASLHGGLLSVGPSGLLLKAASRFQRKTEGVLVNDFAERAID
jgi:hypothetical protein